MKHPINVVVFKGQPQYQLNEHLIARQRLTDEDVKALVKVHKRKLALFDKLEKTDDVKVLKRGALSLQRIEFEMQRIWGFPLDENFHEWYLIPKCTCPKYDNADRRGTPYKVVNGSCPVHGDG